MENEKFEELRNKAMKDFNFENVYKYMKLVDWTWALLDHDGYIPSVQMMKRQVFKLFQAIQESESRCISTGGFTVSLDEDGAGIDFSVENQFIDNE
tara:strand:+ start:65 stop:352 length:288 start_codon:yes stop_codon:yes gene_type:complete